MSDSNRLQVAFIKEVTPGVAPASAYQLVNVSSSNLAAQKATIEENTIRSDRNLKGLVMTNLLPVGGFGFDQIYGNFDTILAALLGATGAAFSTPVSLASTAVTIAGSVITATAGTPFTVLAAGQWITFTITGIKYLVMVTVIGGAGANITVTGATLPSGAQTVLTLKGSFARNGTVMTTLTLEQNHADMTTKPFFQYLGCVPNTYALNAQAEQIVTGSLAFMGMSVPGPTAASASGTGYAAAATNDAIAGLTGNMGMFRVGGAIVLPTDYAIKGVNFNYNNNVRRDSAINRADMGWGQCSITGTLSTFFKGGLTEVDKFYAHTATSFSYSMVDSGGNTMVVTILKAQYGDFQKQIGGKNQAVMGDLNFTGVLDPVTGATVQIDLIPGP